MRREGESDIKDKAKAVGLLKRAEKGGVNRNSIQGEEGLGGKARNSVWAMLNFRWRNVRQAAEMWESMAECSGVDR